MATARYLKILKWLVFDLFDVNTSLILQKETWTRGKWGKAQASLLPLMNHNKEKSLVVFAKKYDMSWFTL